MRRKIKNIGKGQRRININAAAKALGGEKVGVKVNTKQGPISLFSLRQFIMDCLHSSGGRPALVGTTKERKKLPFFEEDWNKLKLIAEYYKIEEGINVSPAQIASILVHRDVAKIDISDIAPLSKSLTSK
ncbi:MAG: hypothetical protein ABIK26_00945 [Candidatus Omnitrophota bacterium]